METGSSAGVVYAIFPLNSFQDLWARRVMRGIRYFVNIIVLDRCFRWSLEALKWTGERGKAIGDLNDLETNLSVETNISNGGSSRLMK